MCGSLGLHDGLQLHVVVDVLYGVVPLIVIPVQLGWGGVGGEDWRDVRLYMWTLP